MHKIIMPGSEIDHKNGDGLDNRKENLRVCSRSQNLFNRRKHSKSSSSYKGVSWNPLHKKWHSRIMKNKKQINLGYFDKEIDAAIAYDESAKKLFGEFCHTNFK